MSEKGGNVEKTHFGAICVFGRANAGKSTIVNALVGEKVSIVSPKPQTTRRRVLGVITQGPSQIVFCDTPGLHPIRNKLDAFMDFEIESTVSGLQGAVFVVDAGDPDPATDKEHLIRLFSKAGFPITLVLNKIDLISRGRLDELKNEYAQLAPFAGTFEVCGKDRESLKPLFGYLLEGIPEGPHAYDVDYYTSLTEREIVAEAIREAVLRRFFHEVPHSVAVLIDEFKERENGKTYVSAELIVERESQKKIIIGKGGEEIKALGMVARTQLNQMLGRDIFLQLWVKVRPNWRKNEEWVRRMGFNKK